MRRAVLVVLSVLSAPSLAWGDTRDDVTAGFYRCARIADDRQWLECLYGSVQPMRSRLGLPPAPESQQLLSRVPAQAIAPGTLPPARIVTAAPPPPVAGAPSDFGRPAGSDHVSRETGRIAAFTFDRFGIFTVTLADGQVWQQSSSDSTKAQWRAPPSQHAYNVTISEGILGSYTLKVVNMPGAYKVRRLK